LNAWYSKNEARNRVRPVRGLFYLGNFYSGNGPLHFFNAAAACEGPTKAKLKQN
jgi:hypothetical protein